MRALFRRKLPRGRPKQGRQRKDKVAEIAKAAIRLLARKDFDTWSMSELAREAGCSVGTLYARFPDKDAWLQYAIEVQFSDLIAAANSALAPPLPSSPAARRAEFLIDHIVSEMTAPSAAGVIRATIKLATIRPEAITKFEEYRRTVNDCAAAMLRDRISNDISRDTIQVAMQIALATVTDSVLQEKPGSMSAGSRRMISALTNVFMGYLGISKDKKWAGTEAEDDEGKVDNEIFADPPKSGPSLYDPKEQGFRRAKARVPSKADKPKTPQEQKSPPIPSKMPKSKSERLPERQRRNSRAI